MQRSWGKVIFSEACVNNSVHGGGACIAGGVCMAGGMHGRGHAWQGACIAWGCAWQGEVCMVGACMAGGHAWQILRDTVNE